MFGSSAEHRVNLLIVLLGVGAAFFLLDQRAPAWLRILPWIMVFGYPIGRMIRAWRSARG